MQWTALLVVIGVVAALFAYRRFTQVPVRTARIYLRQGALVVDVRSNAEFQARHLPHAMHIPLSELETLVARRVSNKEQVLLLHCESGMRSRTAQRRLARLGYTHAFNLGSYARAQRIVGTR